MSPALILTGDIHNMLISRGRLIFSSDRLNGDHGFIVPLLQEDDDSVCHGEQGMILPHFHVFTGMVHCAALAYNDIPCFGELAAVYFHSEPFAVRFASVA